MKFFGCFPQVARYYWVEFEWALRRRWCNSVVLSGLRSTALRRTVQKVLHQLAISLERWDLRPRAAVKGHPSCNLKMTSESENPIAIIACRSMSKKDWAVFICWTLAPRPVIPQQKPTGPGAKILQDLEDSSWSTVHVVLPIGFMNCYTVTMIQTLS